VNLIVKCHRTHAPYSTKISFRSSFCFTDVDLRNKRNDKALNTTRSFASRNRFAWEWHDTSFWQSFTANL